MEMFTISEVAKKLNVSKSVIYLLVNQKKLGSHRIGVGRGTIRISNEDLTAYLQEAKSETSTESRTAEEQKASNRPRLKFIKW